MDDNNHQPTTTPAQDGDPSGVLERLGIALKEARLQRGMERAALASKLCMGEEQLTALENADQSKLPEPVFVIAQARRVADALGVDISLLIAPLKTAAPIASSRPGAEALGRLPSRSVTASRSRRSSAGGGLRWLGGAALVAGLAAAGVLAWPSLQRLPLPLKTLSLAPKTKVSAKPKSSPPPAATKPAIPADQVLVSATQPSWLEVQTNSRTVLFKGTFKGERRFPVGKGLKLLAGRPDLVKVQLGSAPAKPLGTIDQIRWVSVPADQPAAAAPAPAP